jgi:hypothetical protein
MDGEYYIFNKNVNAAIQTITDALYKLNAWLGPDAGDVITISPDSYEILVDRDRVIVPEFVHV